VLQMIEWLKLDVSKDRSVGLLGFSRGAELAVLLGSLVRTTDAIAAIGAYAPSDTVVASYDPNVDDIVHEVDSSGRETIFRYGPAWLWHGKEIYGDQMSIQNVSPTELFAGLDEAAAYEKWRSLWVRGPRIAVERYQGPLFVTHGDQDEIWEVDRARRLVSSRSQQSSVETIYREFAGEGHRFGSEAYALVLQELTDFFVRHL
jgi:pimeloyl-ACP methyl ester carboxylesterase